ncbi:hypothetical protein [Hydrogenovibrio marinus]|nr:hypothetical protein [Hydrogenovibrio marinus]BBN59003.1 hypothetical protein HVMH_0597 [Hydrogenovibrio marinus]
MPALFWTLYVNKSVVRSVILAIGILGSLSLGVGVLLIVLLPLIIKVMHKFLVSSVILFVLLILIVLFSFVPLLTGEPLFYWLADKLMYWFGSGIKFNFPYVNPQTILENSKEASLTDRLAAVTVVLNYLFHHPFGTGAGLGMTTVNYAIAIGFANAALEAGFMGGVFYIIMFLILACMVYVKIWKMAKFSTDEKMIIAIGLSVLTCIVMGLQRQQPDLSFWHMWIYASFLYLTMKAKSEENARETCERIHKL